jgi:hypothetical protein
MGPVAQLVFKTSAVVQPTARSVRLRRRSVEPAWLPADDERQLGYLTDDEPPELGFYCPDCAEREFAGD